MITVTAKDVKRSTLVPPAWYPVMVKTVTPKPAKTDGSTNFFFEMEIADGPFKETPCKDFLVNEKGLFSTGLLFLVACGFPKEMLEKIKKGEVGAQPVDENACVGKTIKAFVGTTTWENRKSNECLDFLPLDAPTPKMPGEK